MRCPECGMLSSSMIPSADQIEEHYRKKFAGGNYQTALRYANSYRKIHAQYVTWIRPKPGERILDIGCFTGELLSLLAAEGADVYGLELQEAAAKIASAKLPGRIFVADLYSEDFPQQRFDTITMMALIEHVIDPIAMLQRCAELLNSGGRLFLETPDSGSLVARISGSHWPPLAPVEHIHLFSSRSLRLALTACGFSDIAIRPHIKTLPVSYVYEMLSHFGPEWKGLFLPVHRLLRNRALPFYVGEVMVSATKRA